MLEKDIQEKWPLRYSVNLANYPVQPEFLPKPYPRVPK
jgi:formylmethanofuran dehydrogenase subunit A